MEECGRSGKKSRHVREELFLERLQKWKEEKSLKEKSKTKMTTSAQSRFRKPLTKVDIVNQKDENIRRQRSILTMNEKLDQWKQTKKIKEENFNLVNKKLNPKGRQVKSRLLDIPLRLNAPQRRSTITNNVTAGKPSVTTRDVVNKQCNPIKPLKRAFPGKLVLAVGPTSRQFVGLKTSLTTSDHRTSFGHRRSSLIRGKVAKGVTHSMQPQGILKRKSCVARLPSQSEYGVRSDLDLHALTHVKFRSPHRSENNENIGSKFRRTPVQSQESLRHKLSSWLATKGKTPSKFRHLMCFDAEMSSRKSRDSRTKQSLTVDEMSQQQDAMAKEENISQKLDFPVHCVTEQECETEFSVEAKEKIFLVEDELNTMLSECQTLLANDCPVESILAWLQKIYDGIPNAKKSTRFYLTKVGVLKPMGDLDLVLATFEDAISNSSQPADELATAMTITVREMTDALLKRNIKEQITCSTNSVSDNNVFESTAIKYCVRDVTPFKKRKYKSLCGSEHSPAARAIITPVRRSTRKGTPARPDVQMMSPVPNGTDGENKRHCLSVERTKLYDSLDDVPEEERTRLLFQPNEVMKTLLFDE